MRFTPFSTARTSIAYKTINEPLESLDRSSKGLAYFPDTSSPFPSYSRVPISPIQLQYRAIQDDA